MQDNVSVPTEDIAEFCRKHQVARLSLFGSVLRSDFGPESDIDLLIEFDPGTRVGLLGLAGMEMELTQLLGRRVDLRTPAEISRYFRDRVVADAEAIYVH